MAHVPDEIIDLFGDARALDTAEWIGTGRKYPINPPANLRAYIDSLYAIPVIEPAKLFPDSTLTVIEFAMLDLPKTRIGLLDFAT